MAETSTTYTYRIGHIEQASKKANASSINPEQLTEIPVYPTQVHVGSNLISRSWNNVAGDFIDMPIAEKLKIQWKFEGASATVARQLFKELIRDEIYASTGSVKSRLFEINTWAPGLGWVKGTFYLGTPTEFDSEGVASGNEGAAANFELHWIEVGDNSTHLS